MCIFQNLYAHAYLLADVSESQCLQTPASTNNLIVPGDDNVIIMAVTGKDPEYYEVNNSNCKAELSSHNDCEFEDSDQPHVHSAVS